MYLQPLLVPHAHVHLGRVMYHPLATDQSRAAMWGGIFAVNDTAVTIYKYESTRKVCGLELLNKVQLENRGPRKEKQVTVSEGKLAALEKEMLNAAECALMKMMMLEGKAKVSFNG